VRTTQKLHFILQSIYRLRKIFGPTKEAKCIWRIKTDEELDELLKHWNIINCVKAQ
jgi:hypothetical protein